MLIFTTTGITLSGTGVTVRITHGLGATPNMIIPTLRGTTATGGVAVVTANATTLDVCAIGVGSGLCDVVAQVFHSIIQ